MKIGSGRPHVPANEPSLIAGHPSHGCIRVPNWEIVKLARLLPIGTPLTIE